MVESIPEEKIGIVDETERRRSFACLEAKVAYTKKKMKNHFKRRMTRRPPFKVVEIFTGAPDESERVKCTNTADEIIAAKKHIWTKEESALPFQLL